MSKIASIKVHQYVSIPYQFEYKIDITIPNGEDPEEYIKAMHSDELKKYCIDQSLVSKSEDGYMVVHNMGNPILLAVQGEDCSICANDMNECVCEQCDICLQKIYDCLCDEQSEITQVDAEEWIDENTTEYMELAERYDIKLQELREMLKSLNFVKQDILNKINMIRLWGKTHRFKVDMLDEKNILKVAYALRILYRKLWTMDSQKLVERHYSKLIDQLKTLYTINEVIQDWGWRRYSLANYEDMMVFLSRKYFLDELKAKFDSYQQKQIYYPDAHSEYLLDWHQICQQYQDHIHDVGIKQEVVVCGVEFNMVYCPSGEFWMGSDNRNKNEKPRHLIKMTKGFWIGETPVTQKLWKAVMGWNESSHKKSVYFPVSAVTWYDCVMFCNRISELQGLKPHYIISNIKKVDWKRESVDFADVEWNSDANGYRLPTEAEWEYCAKAGTELTYAGSDKINEVAWYDYNSERKLQKVKSKQANAWGLYDMSGNVFEWSHDTFDENIYKNRTSNENPVNWNHSSRVHILRGGSHNDDATKSVVTFRYRCSSGLGFPFTGLRLLRYDF
jgi:sulfatase modifying factor 1